MLKKQNLSSLRLQEYKVLLYRILLAYVFYQVARLLFYGYNHSLIKVGSVGEYLKLAFYGITFDTTAILYTNALFILLSVLPLWVNTQQWYQKTLTVIYFIFNGLALSLNFVDFIYYKYILSRSTKAAFESLEHEQNKTNLFSEFIINYWHVYLLFIVVMWLWYLWYKKIKLNVVPYKINLIYFLSSIIFIPIVIALSIGGIRGDFKKSTRPINMLDASKNVNNLTQSDLVLNTAFAFIRTFNVQTFQPQHFMSDKEAEALVKPIKQYHGNFETERPNIVLIIVESFGKEYIGFCNQNSSIPHYKSYTPFLDSLAQHSYIFTNAYANGYKSIHGMSSVICGIPSFENAFTSSVYVQQPITSLISILKKEGYSTSYFHGAPNGSMGFLGFSNILGIDHYYGMTEFNDDTQFDGFWGIWDEPFLQFMNQKLNDEKEPFMATVFTVSSHEPYVIPQQYEGKFPKGDIKIHQTVAYTDYALQQFFAAAQKEKWYNNTIFIITADHSNITYYNDYQKVMNWNTVPILFYSPSNKLVGSNHELAQQIDIMPSVLQLINYQKPFRSWGRSLFSSETPPFVIRFANGQYQFIKNGFVLVFDGTKAVGLYHFDDKALNNNVIKEFPNQVDTLERECKAFIQVYMNSILNRKL